MSWQNPIPWCTEIGPFFYALILSPTVHFALELISGGTEETWHLRKQSAWELVKLQRPHWFTKPNLMMMWTKNKWFLSLLGSGWECEIRLYFWLPQVLAMPTSGCFVYCIEVVSVTCLGYSFSSQYQLWQFSVWHLMSSINCLCFISFAGMNRGKLACRHTGNIFPDRKINFTEAFISICGECKEQVGCKRPQNLRSTCSFKFSF